MNTSNSHEWETTMWWMENSAHALDAEIDLLFSPVKNFMVMLLEMRMQVF